MSHAIKWQCVPENIPRSYITLISPDWMSGALDSPWLPFAVDLQFILKCSVNATPNPRHFQGGRSDLIIRTAATSDEPTSRRSEKSPRYLRTSVVMRRSSDLKPLTSWKHELTYPRMYTCRGHHVFLFVPGRNLQFILLVTSLSAEDRIWIRYSNQGGDCRLSMNTAF